MTLTLWRIHLASLRNALRDDGTSRALAGLYALVTAGAGLWSATRLAETVAAWQAAGVLDGRLWLAFAGLWLAFAFFGAWGTLRAGLADDGAALLATLPIPPAPLFRVLAARVVAEQVGLFALIVALALVGAMGGAALPWLGLWVAGSVAACGGAAVATLATVGQTARGQRLRAAVGLAMAGAGVGGLAALLWFIRPAPGLVGAALGVAVGVGLGPLAGAGGRLYGRALVATQGRSRARRVWVGLGVGAVSRRLGRRRDVAGALLFKEWLGRSRSPLTWLRVLALPLYLSLFPWLHGALAARFALPDGWLVVAFSVLLALLFVVDGAPSPVGSEGDRLTLALVAPVSPGALLRAKLWGLVWLVEAVGLGSALVLGLWVGLPLGSLLGALAAAALILAALAALVVLGSVWDEDLTQAVEGPTQTMVQEEVPFTPVRLGLLNGGLALAAAMLALLWALPLPLALAALAGLAALVTALLWRGSLRRLARLLRG